MHKNTTKNKWLFGAVWHKNSLKWLWFYNNRPQDIILDIFWGIDEFSKKLTSGFYLFKAEGDWHVPNDPN